LLPLCGDGIVDSGEQCDNGALSNAPNSCRAGCLLPYCGDGVTDPTFGEVCDNGQANSDYTGSCSTTCTLNSCRSCSSGARTLAIGGSFDATSPAVTYSGSQTVPPCTEGVQWYVFTNVQSISPAQYNIVKSVLPPSNARGVQPLNGRSCSFTALSAPVCGNCLLEAGEQCDAGDNNQNAPDKCRTNCKKPACGDGIVDSGESCDNGAANNPLGPCGTNCQPVLGCPVVCAGSSCPSCSASTATSTATSSATCPTSGCGCGATTTNNSGTVININFANLLRGAGCSSASSSASGGCGCA